MLARRSVLRLPSDAQLETPLFVPSFSSRGFPVRDDGKSTWADAFVFASELIQDAFLISAYDIYHGHLPGVEGLREFPALGPYGGPKVIFVDSGFYEIGEAWDPSEPRLVSTSTKDWDPERLDETLASRCSPDLSIIVVNPDTVATTSQQILAARTFFSRYPTFGHDFLLKPEQGRTYVRWSDVIGLAGELRAFDLVGMAEKELGGTLLERMETIARIRRSMDDADVSIPIHVFGSLDPILSPLYFLAGAEIFDGLAWLYLGFKEGVAMYGEALAALDADWTARASQRRQRRLAANLTSLDQLTIRMKRFLLDPAGDFGAFAYHQELLRDGNEALRTKLEKVSGRK